MATQTAIALTAIGSNLQKLEVPIREPANEEILIKVTATAVINYDQKLRDFGIFDIGNRLPAVVCFDLVGIVQKHSPTLSAEYVAKFPIGTHVFGQPSTMFHPLAGGLQEYTMVNAPFTARVPSNITDVQAALFPINAFTAFASLFSNEGDYKGLGIPYPGTAESKDFDYQGVKLVILGAGSRIGKLAVQIAKKTGFGTIAAVAATSNHAQLKELGATHVFDRKQEPSELTKEIKTVFEGSDTGYVFDTWDFNDFTFAVSLLQDVKQGYLCRLLPGEVDVKGANIREGQLFGTNEFHPTTSVLFWKEIEKWVEEGLEGGVYKETVGLDEKVINDTLDAYRDGGFERLHIKVA